MSTMTLLDAIERPSILGPDRDRHDHDHEAPQVGGAPTLDDLLRGIWDALCGGRVAACPLCDAALDPRYGAGPSPVAARCTRCDTELS